MKFSEFKLHPDLQKGIDEAGYIDCMPVQEQVLLNTDLCATCARDLYVQSRTGTGKTAAFLTVIFNRMLTEEDLFRRKALIMAPTRELAVQIEEEAKMLGKYLPFKTGCFYGGVGYAQQEKLLRENAQILVGTPGRVLDLNKTGKMNLMDISFLVLDEADRMFDMGFYPDLRKLIKVVPPADRRQTMLFSATLNAWVKNLAWEYTKGSKGGQAPLEIEIKSETVTVDEITQALYHVPSSEKTTLLLGILKNEQPESAIIFCNTKKQTEITAKRLRINGIPCEYIIGDLPQVKRLKVINDLKNGKIKTLVATDVAARGLDIEGLSMVINYDIPAEAENYVHRIGRTARAGKTGKAVSLVSEQDVYELPAIERYIGQKIPSEIAMQDHYAQDKSSGQRIQTEFYEEKNRKESLPRTIVNRHGRKNKEDKIFSRTTDTDNAQRVKNKKEILPRKHANQNQHGNSGAGVKEQQDLSQMSMEERMAFYKKKYAAPEILPAKLPAVLPAKLPAENKHVKTDAEKMVRRHEANIAKEDAAEETAMTANETPVRKKSLMSKIRELFRKNK